MITIKYEISEKAARKEFIENGIYYRADNGERWLELDFDATALNKDDRQLILEECTEVGNGDFIYELCYVNVVCKTIGDFLDVLREDKD